jgi:hypothetical protein
MRYSKQNTKTFEENYGTRILSRNYFSFAQHLLKHSKNENETTLSVQ